MATSVQPGAGSVDSSKFDIVKATQYGTFERVVELVEKEGVDPAKGDKENITPLHWAAINNRLNVAEYLICHGAPVDVFGGELNSTPLHWATRQGHLSMVTFLLKHGANPEALDGEGLACLHLSSQLGFIPILIYLCALGQNVNLPDKKGMTPIMWACLRCIGREPTGMLLKFNASINLTDNKKNTGVPYKSDVSDC
jgi:palmitoyltransferase